MDRQHSFTFRTYRLKCDTKALNLSFLALEIVDAVEELTWYQSKMIHKDIGESKCVVYFLTIYFGIFGTTLQKLYPVV
jgi:hypothetical protein